MKIDTHTTSYIVLELEKSEFRGVTSCTCADQATTHSVNIVSSIVNKFSKKVIIPSRQSNKTMGKSWPFTIYTEINYTRNRLQTKLPFSDIVHFGTTC